MATERRSTPERAAPVVTSQQTADALAQRQAAEAEVKAEAEEKPLDEIHFDEGEGYMVNGELVDANGNPVGKDAEPRTEAAER